MAITKETQEVKLVRSHVNTYEYVRILSYTLFASQQLQKMAVKVVTDNFNTVVVFKKYVLQKLK